MALPSSVNTVYAPGSQVKSADLNDLQNQIVVAQTAVRRRSFSAMSGLADVPSDWTIGTGTRRSTVAAPSAFYIPVVLGFGEFIRTFTVHWQHSVATAGAMTAALTRSSSGGTATLATISSAASTSPQTQTSSAIDLNVLDDTHYYVVFGFAGGAMTRDIWFAKISVRTQPFLAGLT